jgi:hypothetical protein
MSSSRSALTVRFMPGRDTSLRFFARDLLFMLVYGPAVDVEMIFDAASISGQ